MLGEFPVGLGIPPLQLKILFESNPLKSRILVRRLAIEQPARLDMVGLPRFNPRDWAKTREFTKGGFSKGGFSN